MYFRNLSNRVSSSLLGPLVPSFRALSGRLKFTVRRDKFNKDFLSQPHLMYHMPPEVNHIGVELTAFSHQRVKTEPSRTKESRLTLLGPSIHSCKTRRGSIYPTVGSNTWLQHPHQILFWLQKGGGGIHYGHLGVSNVRPLIKSCKW